MIKTIPHARRMNLIALALLVTALIAFIAYHFMVVRIYTNPGLLSKSQDVGWEIWPDLVRYFRQHLSLNDLRGMIAVSAFLTYCLLVVASPFLIPFLRMSRLGWWITVITSGVAMCGFGGMILISDNDPSFSTPGPGVHCILASLALNFLGLLFIRREVPAAPEVDPT